MARVALHLRQHLIGYLALFAALGGTSYAATTTLAPANSVGTKQVINHSLRKVDFKPGQLPRGPRGPRGIQGPPGAQGPQGTQGAVGISTMTAANSAPATMCATGGGGCQVAGVTASCPSGSVVTGGGWVSDSIDLIVPYAKRTAGTDYSVIAINYDTVPRTITGQAICAAGPGATAAGASATGGATFVSAFAQAKARVGK